MARKKRKIPVVGTRGLHTAQLSPEVRSILKRRAEGAAQRAYAPQIAAKKQAIGSVRKGFQNERQSILGATDMAENSLSQALRGLGSSGLQGRYLKQATSELTARRGDVAQSIPFLLSDAAQQRNEALTGARQELTETRAARDQSAAEAFNSLLKEEREDASGALKRRAAKLGEKEEDGLSEAQLRRLGNADLALKDALAAWSQNIEVEGPEGDMVPVQSINPLKRSTSGGPSPRASPRSTRASISAT